MGSENYVEKPLLERRLLSRWDITGDAKGDTNRRSQGRYQREMPRGYMGITTIERYCGEAGAPQFLSSIARRRSNQSSEVFTVPRLLWQMVALTVQGLRENGGAPFRLKSGVNLWDGGGT